MGKLQVVITDQSGAIIAHASVHVTNPATGYEADFESNDSGIYTASELLVGSYIIRIGIAGFKTELDTNLVLNAGTVLLCSRPAFAIGETGTLEVFCWTTGKYPGSSPSISASP